jgi:putative transposase
MPRANRYITAGSIYHVTHRCHDREFLFKFARERNGYRSLLREHLHDSDVSLLAYCITSNHVHLLMNVGAKESLSALMQLVAGEFAQNFNRRKKRSGAFWGDRFHATLVDSDEYLLRCMRYIDLNMVRAGVVDHPEDWDWCGYRELLGLRKRYRLIDRARLLEILEGDPDRLFESYRGSIEEGIAQREFAREAMGTESLAVGSEAFVRRMEETIRNRRRLETGQSTPKSETTSNNAWVLREDPSQDAYSGFSALKIAPKDL